MVIEIFDRLQEIPPCDADAREIDTPQEQTAGIMSASPGISGGMRARLQLRHTSVYTRRFAPVLVACAAFFVSACSSGGGGGPSTAGRPTTAPAPAPAPLTTGGPPPTFTRTTADLKVSRLIDVREGLSKTALWRAANEVLSSKYSIDVSDQKAGFLMTPWQASFSRAGMPDLRYRTRVVIRFVGEDWKQVLVRAEANWQRDEEWDVGVDNALLEDVSNEVRAKIGKKTS